MRPARVGSVDNKVTLVVERENPLRVSVLSAQKLTRAGVMQLLRTDPQRVCVVDEASECRVDACDVTVCDFADLTRASGNALIRLLGRNIPIVGLVQPEHPDLVDVALAIGVATTVSMNVTAQALVDAVASAASSRCTDDVANPGTYREAVQASAGLSRREMEILELIITGLTNQEIAATLWLSINSVKTYIRTAYRKIGATRRPEAVLWGYHHGLTETGEEAELRG
jgi:DNA-binding NarL/FixJ family response regulator